MNEKLIRHTNNISEEDIKILREKYIAKYSRKKGWDANNLTHTQLLEIVQSNEYKNPGIIKG